MPRRTSARPATTVAAVEPPTREPVDPPAADPDRDAGLRAGPAHETATTGVAEQDLADVSLFEAFGGRRGVLDSGLPPLTFVGTYLATGSDLTIALIAALGSGVVVTLLRLARRDTLRHSLAGFGAVALAAFVASRTGRPQDYFLPSLLANLGAALAWAVSIWIRRPFLGLTVGALTRSSAWRTDPGMLAAYCRASWIWVASFLVRVVVMTPLWLAGQTVALGLAKVALGWPMVLVVLWLSWQVVEPAHRTRRQRLAAEVQAPTQPESRPATGPAAPPPTGPTTR
jgi:Protein of unknown function (DUF3159)